MLQYVAVCCSMLQCVSVCCSMLQYVALCCSMFQYVAVRFSMLKCVAVYYSMLQYVAVRFSMLQCVAVCCNMLQWTIMSLFIGLSGKSHILFGLFCQGDSIVKFHGANLAIILCHIVCVTYYVTHITWHIFWTSNNFDTSYHMCRVLFDTHYGLAIYRALLQKNWCHMCHTLGDTS